jgi:hypothetical protein
MERNSQLPKHCLVIVGLLFYAIASQAQEPNRQLIQSNSSNATAAKRIALVIGNGAYTTAPPLKNPPNDARDMAAALKTLGFDVSSGINVGQRDVKRLIREFGMKLKAGGSGLFYYAGHGVQSKGRNYLIPVDANIQSEAEVEDSGVDASLVLNFMDDAQNGLNIVILDACRNNPFSRSFRSASDGLAQVDAPTGTLIAYATAPGRVASDGTGQNGLYTSELLKQMQVPGVSITDMFMRVRAEVMKQTGSKQVPWEASSLVGSFYFTGAPNDAAPAISSSRIDPTAFELSYWDTIKNSTNADDFKAYLERYPNGQFVALAKNRIANLDPPNKPAESKPVPVSDSATEIAFWDSIKNSTNAGDFRAYLQKYPNGAFAELARNRLAPLDAGEKEKVRADEIARNTKSFKGHYLRRGAWTTPGTLTVSPNKIQFVYRPEEKPTVFQCSDLSAATLEGVFVREIRDPDGQGTMRFEAESTGMAADALAAMKYVCANPGVKFPAAEETNSPNAVSGSRPTGTTFTGYFGVMSAGFQGRPGKLEISPAGIRFVWDKGRDGIAGDKPYTFSQNIQENPNPYQLSCASFAKARTDDVFIREISKKNAELLEVIGEGGFVARFKASSPAEAAEALAAVRAFCSRTSSASNLTSLAGTSWTGDSPGGDKHYEFRFQAGGIVVWNQKMASNVTYEGTWSQNGNQITMNFRGLEDPVLVTINGDQMAGSWYKGRYKLTLSRTN